MVGVALDAAESTLKSAVTVTAPLTTPLLGYVERLKPLDDWACRRLDDVEMMMPAITKPTEEVKLCINWNGTVGELAASA